MVPPSMGTRPPTDVCCVVDVSGSMGVECANGDAESQGLSVLDVVKHACKTVAHSLSAQDRFSLVRVVGVFVLFCFEPEQPPPFLKK